MLDTAPEESFDAVVALARQLAETPIALVSLVDECRQWFKAAIGLEVEETPRDVAFCSVAIEEPVNRLVVPDATQDVRFRDNPLVVGPPGIRFYAGIPVCDGEGLALGTLCVIDTVPRALSEEQLDGLARLAELVESLLAQRIALARLEQVQRHSVLFEAGFDSSQVGMQLVSPDGVLLRVNEAFAEMVGRTPDDLIGRHWRELTHPEDLHEDGRILAELASGRRGRHREVKRYLRPDGTITWGDINVTAVFPDGTNRPDRRLHLTQVVDVSDHVDAVQRASSAAVELAASERRYRSLVEPAPDIVVRATVDGIINDANQVAVAALGATTRDELTGRRLVGLLPDELARRLLDEFATVAATSQPAELWRQWIEPADRPGGWYVVRIVAEIGDDAPVPHVFVVASEITEIVENERRLAELATTDELTGCASRGAVLERLQRALDQLVDPERPGIAVAVVDLDRFKHLNDTYGHLRGDAALQAAAHALAMVTREGDLVGRLGGDEFVVVFDRVGDPGAASQLGHRIARSLDAATTGSGADAALSGSVGVAWTCVDTAVNDLLARADRAMYEAKRRGGAQSWMAPTPNAP